MLGYCLVESVYGWYSCPMLSMSLLLVNIDKIIGKVLLGPLIREYEVCNTD